jgi:hypothetical protein
LWDGDREHLLGVILTDDVIVDELCKDIISEENKSSLVKSREGIPTPKEIL